LAEPRASARLIPNQFESRKVERACA
jgi:hypothetical protein